MRVTSLVICGLLAGSLGLLPNAIAQPASPMINPVGPTADSAALPPNATVDDVLDALHDRGQNLREFVADVELAEVDTIMSSSSKRIGKVWFQTKSNGDAKLRVRFDQRVVGERPPQSEVKEYLLDEGWLTDRDYRAKNETRYQIARPGEKVNLFQLGKGPFPLPIGQEKKAVLDLFEVTKVPPGKDDPANSIHLQLKPKEKTDFERKFSTIDVWVDVNTKMPVRIETMDRNQTTVRTTDLKNLQVNPNPGLKDADFALQVIDADGWNRHEEPFTQ
jgi:outer membrane lipoprotein-sorting protein